MSAPPSPTKAKPEPVSGSFQYWTLVQWGVYALFYTIVALSLPFIFSQWVFIGLSLASLVLFTAVISPLMHWWVFDSASVWSNASLEKKKEVHNRLVSLVFNISTGVPSYAAYLELTTFLPLWSELMAGQTEMMHLFTAWVIGYILYDFPTLGRTFGKGATVIQLHHVAEALIMWSYCAGLRIGSLYVIGGGLMQLSSGMLHIQRLKMISDAARRGGPAETVADGAQAGSPPVMRKDGTPYAPSAFASYWKWPLAAAWLHARLLVFPYLQYVCLGVYPFNALHAFLFIAGVILNVMNASWLHKIIKMKSLSF